MPVPRRPTTARSMVACALLLSLAGGCAASESAQPTTALATPRPLPTSPPPRTPPPVDIREPRPTQRPPADRHAARPPTGEPVRVVVTTMGGKALVDSRLIPQALDGEGSLAPPPGVVGWYDEPGWPRPGFPGAAILAGHINTRKNGPDTFAHLPEVRPGATARVSYSSGDTVEFVVTRSQAVPKRKTPLDDTIWDPDNPRPLLRLITCDPTTPVRSGHYVGNWVVWAVPTS